LFRAVDRASPLQYRPRALESGSPAAWLERRAGRVAALLLALLFLQGLVFIGESSQTSDEAAHLAAGYSYLTRGDFRLNPEHPPLMKELAALPLLPLGLDFPTGPLWESAEEWNIGQIFVHENRVPNDTLLFLARLPTLMLSVLLGAAMFLWGRRLVGAVGALLGVSLYVLDPNVVAHSSLVTTDLGITLFIFLAVVAFHAWIERPGTRRLIPLGLAVGGAFASKYTALWLPPILALLALVVLLPRASNMGGALSGTRLRRLRTLLLAAAVVIAVGAAVVLLSYGVVGIDWWREGLRRTLLHSEKGHRAYLMGSVSETGWWYYFPLAYLVKTPPGTLLLLAAAGAAAALGRRFRARDEAFLLIPIAVTLVIVAFWKVNIGLRHLLPIYPFLYLAAGRLVDGTAAAGRSAGAAARRTRKGLAALCVLGLGWNVVEAIRIAPYHLAYFNPFAGGPLEGDRWLLDSNYDWGQAHKALLRYMGEQGVSMIYCAYTGNSDPWYYGVHYQYVPGSGNLPNAKERPVRVPPTMPRELFAINAMVLHSLHFTDAHLYDWLFDRRTVGRPGYSWFVYDITRDADSHAAIAALCLSFGLVELASDEAHRALIYAPGNRLAQAVLQKIREHDEGPAVPPGSLAPRRP
jgi:4-amino-4-deoxy-L-arabinose transferase-like glycosyltransferase